MLEPLRLDIEALTNEPFDLDLLRAHCNVDVDHTTLNDDLLVLYMQAAIAWAEGEMHRTIFSRVHRWALRSFPYDCYSEIRLPRGKTQSVQSVIYYSNGSPVTLTGPNASPPGTDFQQSLRGDDGGVIMPPIAGSWPSADLNVPEPVLITFTAGWATASVPADILQALFFYVSDAYELRGTDDLEKGRYFDIRNFKISPYRLHRWY